MIAPNVVVIAQIVNYVVRDTGSAGGGVDGKSVCVEASV